MDSRNCSLSVWDESENYCYISQVDFIRKLRDIYKEGTERTFDEKKAQLEQDCEEKKQQAGNAITLLRHCRETLQELDDQRKSIGMHLKEQAEQGKALTERIRQERQRSLNESNIKQLLNELRRLN